MNGFVRGSADEVPLEEAWFAHSESRSFLVSSPSSISAVVTAVTEIFAVTFQSWSPGHVLAAGRASDYLAAYVTRQLSLQLRQVSRRLSRDAWFDEPSKSAKISFVDAYV